MSDTLVVFDEVESIIAQGALDPANRDTFFVQWDLVGNIGADPDQPGCCIFLKDRLFGIVDKLFALKRPSYCITLAGFEPTLHPLLPDLLEYLFSKDQKVHVILKTDGGKDSAYLASLLALCPEGTLTLDLQVRPDSQEGHIESLLLLAKKQKQGTHITFIYDQSRSDESERLAYKVKEICAKHSCELSSTSHELDVVFETVGEPLVARYLSCYEDPEYKEPTSVSIANVPFLCENFYCCLGLNALYIAQNGQFSQAKGLPFKPMGFWNVRDKILAKMVTIEQCKEPFFFEESNLVLPKFKTLDAAQAWIEESLARFSQEKEVAPKSLIPTREDIVRSRILHCREKSASSPIGADPAWVQAHFHDICELYANLKDAHSKDILLGAMKSLEEGDLRYLPPAGSLAVQAQEGDVVVDGCPDAAPELCSRVYLTQDDACSRLEGCLRTLYAYKPQVYVVTKSCKEILRITQWLFDHTQDYTVTLHREGDGIAVLADPKEKPLRRTAPSTYPHPELSVIIPVSSEYDDETITRCVNALLVQERDDIEILLIAQDTYSTGDDCVATFVRTHPTKIRCMRLDEGSYSAVLSAGFAMALGTYCVVLEPKDTVSWDFLRRGIEYAQKESPDIIAFDRVYCSNETFEHWGVTQGTYSFDESLAAFLEEKTGACGIEGRLINREFFQNLRLGFDDFGSDTSLAYGIALHLYSRKTLVVPEYICFTEKNTDEDTFSYDEQLPPFAAFVSWFETFCKSNGLDSESYPLGTVLEHAYAKKREALLSSCNDVVDAESVSDEVIRHITSSKALFSTILKDYALLHCQRESIEPHLEADEETPAYRVCADAFDGRKSPRLSVIVHGNDSNLPGTLESVLSQDMEDFECIIVDDAKDSEHLEILQAFADLNPKIRLFTMEQEASANTCVSTALSLTCGQYVIFVEEGDICRPGYFSKALEKIEDTAADLVSFSLDLVDADSGIRENRATRERSEHFFEDEQCADFLEEDADCYGAIFDRKVIASLNFAGGSTYFLSSFVRRAESIVCDAANVYERKQRDTDEEHSASLAQLQALYAEANEDRISLLLQNVAAFWQERDAVPMTQAEYTALASNIPFVRSILTGYASLFEECDEEKGVLPGVSERKMDFFDITQSLQPYISIYNPVCMPSSHEIAALRENPRLFTLFLNDYATRYCEQKGDEPSFDDAPMLAPRQQPASYLIPSRTNQQPESALLSIVIVTRNSAEVLDNCLKSIVSEKGDQIEVVVVDDASDSDNSYLKALEYQKKDPRIQVYRTPWFSGCGQARNLGVSKTKGEWLLFLDPKDWLCKGFVSRIGSELSQSVDCLDLSWKVYSDESQLVRTERMAKSGQKTSEALFKNLLNEKNKNGLWSKVIRKEVLEKKGLAFLPHRTSDDFLFLVSLYVSNIQIASSNLYAVNHREEELQDMSDERSWFAVEGGNEVIENIERIHSLLCSHGYQESSDEYQKVLSGYVDGKCMDALLYPVYMTKKLGLAFPLDQEKLSGILASDVFVERCLYTFKKLLRGEMDESSDGDIQ